jgi:hypothetical protein
MDLAFFLSFIPNLPLSPSHAHTFNTCSRLVLPGLAVVARRVDSSRCLELPGVAAGADARPCDICTHFITNNPVQVFTSQYIKMTLLRALVITFICMYVCMYVIRMCVCIYVEREREQETNRLFVEKVLFAAFPVPQKHSIVVYPTVYHKCPNT